MSNFLLRVGVLRGGPSAEHEVSLNSGSAVIHVLRDNFPGSYQAYDIFIDRRGHWHIDGTPISIPGLHSRIDIAFNALHGNYGEDGKIQALLESHGIPFTGSGSVGSALGMNKILSKEVFKDHGIKSPYWVEVSSKEIMNNLEPLALRLFSSLVLPGVVKPTSSGSSVGVSVIRSFHDLPDALLKAVDHGHSVMIEEYIPGIETTCGVIENFRGQTLYALPPIEIRPHSGFFDYAAKYESKSEEIVPATFSNKIKKEVEELAMKIHTAFGLRHYSRSDFIIHPRRGIYALEVNTLPGLTKESLMPKALRAVGSDLHELVAHLLELAKGRR